MYRPGASGGGEVDLDILDGRYVTKTGDTMTGRLVSDRESGEAPTVQQDGVTTLSLWASGAIETQRVAFTDKHLMPKWAIDVEIAKETTKYLPLAGGTLVNPLNFQRGADKTHSQYKISPNGGSDYATNIYTFEGQMRFRTTHTNQESDAVGSHIVLDPDTDNNGANPVTKIWKVPNPTANDMPANKAYVDELTVTSTNTTKGINYKGQACVTSSATPSAEQYWQGALIFSTATNSLYIRT